VGHLSAPAARIIKIVLLVQTTGDEGCCRRTGGALARRHMSPKEGFESTVESGGGSVEAHRRVPMTPLLPQPGLSFILRG
jgi:hypothetical protein